MNSDIFNKGSFYIRRINLFLQIIILANLCFASEEKEVSEIPSPKYETKYFSIVDKDDVIKKSPFPGTKIPGLDLFHSPMSLTIITRDQLLNSGVRHLTEALEIYVPGFQAMINKWYGTIWGLRGVASDINDKFIFLINGIKQNLQSRDGAITEMNLGCLNDIERIEVLRGPAGLSYGSGAIAGVINVVTRRKGKSVLESAFTFGTYDFNNNSFNYDKQLFLSLPNDISLAVSLGFMKSDGMGQENGSLWGFPSYNYPESTKNGKFKSNWVPVTGSPGEVPGNYRASFNIEYKKFRWYSRFTRHIQQASGWYVYDPWPDRIGYADSTFPSVKINNEVIDTSHELWDFWSKTEGFGENRRVYKVDNLMSMVSWDLNIAEDNLTLNADFTGASDHVYFQKIDGFNLEDDVQNQAFGEKRLGFHATYLLNRIPNLRCAGGYELYIDFIGKGLRGENSYKEKRKTPVVKDATYINHAFFIEDFYDFLGKGIVGIDMGIRYDIYNKMEQGILSPKISLIYTPTEKHAIKFIFQKSSNYGTASIHEENFYFINDTGSTINEPHFEWPDRIPNQDTDVIPGWDFIKSNFINEFKPEEAKSFEISSSHLFFNEKLFLGTSFSYNIFENIFLWCQEIYRRINTGKYRSVNLCLESSFHSKSKKFNLGFNHVLQKVVNTRIEESNKVFKLPYYEKSDSPLEWCDSDTLDNGDVVWRPTESDSMTDYIFNSIESQITRDENSFLNLSDNVTKLFINIIPLDWLMFHVNTRIFWGLEGRKAIVEKDSIEEHTYLDIESAPIIKLNAGIQLKLFHGLISQKENTFIKDVRLSLFGYDLLGIPSLKKNLSGAGRFFTRNSIRWQQMSYEKDRDLYAVDKCSFSARLDVDF